MLRYRARAARRWRMVFRGGLPKMLTPFFLAIHASCAYVGVVLGLSRRSYPFSAVCLLVLFSPQASLLGVVKWPLVDALIHRAAP